MGNEFVNINFVGSYPSAKLMPATGLPEYAFIGRSNVGKSTLINYLSNRKAIAKTSKKPGKTQTINLYNVDDKWAIVDLPGYGYASTSKQARRNWMKMIYDYLENRDTLANCFVLLDSRHKLQDVDRDFLLWLGEKQIPFSIIFTKTDVLSKNKTAANIAKIKKELLSDWEYLPDTFAVSSLKRMGREAILAYIESINKKIR